MISTNHKLIIVSGPTAVGKTAFALQLARHYKTEIISADSRQLYREMTIGTAKPSPVELEEVKHHFIDHLSIRERYSSGDFEKDALELLERLFLRNDKVIVAGGTGLYIKALTEGFDEMPAIDIETRSQLNNWHEKEGLNPLLNLLKEKDPEYYEKVDKYNYRRIIRALEVCLTSGKPFSTFRSSKSAGERNFDSIYIGLTLDREILYERIDQRVDIMIQMGLFEEAKRLFSFRSLEALQTVGYKEFFQHLEGAFDFEEAVRLIKRNTRRYAKRQLTWLNNRENVTWFAPDDIAGAISFIEKSGI
ncbi:MAG: tRNA (adenosine(37)-N6)-dimethylallyltransferase MiaA [Cyclobacteriaceae bacterium]|nr:tRNA (adenosine(37)-N6)-dimethylallyltransferase MiaA [Cyclobacteriaceae bacterium]